jgi:hypothetical protein
MPDIDDLRTRAEITNYEETSRYDEVMTFIRELERRSGGLVRIESFGQTEEGRDMPLMSFGVPDTARPTVFVMANIHAGEVEGKEAMLALSRRLVAGDLRGLLDKLFLLVAPIYNADGNERISLQNRSEQYGPIGGVGTRHNARGLDLNRDYMKLETAEARALARLFNRWNPHLTVDLHTTNGSWHGYDLTFSPSLNPNADPQIIAYERERILPAVSGKVRENHGYRTYFYGNFAVPEAFGEEVLQASEPVPPGRIVWRTFDHRPRFGNNYLGLRNRLTILSEAYSYLDFKQRIDVTSAFVEEILKYAAEHRADIMAVLEQIEMPRELGVEFELRALPEPVEILVGAVEKKINPRSGLEMVAALRNRVTPMPMKDYGIFEATRRVPVPEAYVLSAPSSEIVEKLEIHGIVMRTPDQGRAITAARFVIEKMSRAEHAFQGHYEVRVRGHWREEQIVFNPGAIVVPTSQPLGRLVFHLLDPESDDGFVTWEMLKADEVFRLS